MNFYARSLGVLLISSFLASPMMAAERSTTKTQTLAAAAQFQKALLTRFHIKSVGNRDIVFKVPSFDCDISITLKFAPVQYAAVTIRRGQDRGDVLGADYGSISFEQNSSGFTFSNYKEDCETQGCDGDWYPYSTLWVGAKIATVTSVESYSHKVHTTTCILK